ncbi:MAG: YciI family protein [Anaeromyxobacteraceae bacterium]
MYVIAIVRYRKPLEELQKHQDAHRAWASGLRDRGLIVASGPLEPRFGGAILLRFPDGTPDAEILALRDQDPYVKGGVAQWELLPWSPVNGKENLDRA